MTPRFILLLCAGCTSSPGARPTPPPTDITDSWDVVSLTCDGAALPDDHTRSYKFDASHAVRIELQVDDATHQCLIGYAYTRLVQSAASGATYEETSLLGAAGTKTECRMKQGGVAVDPPTTMTGTFGPESVALTMVADGDTIALDLVHPAACPHGTEHVELVKRE